jgi:hypothetical protein
VTNELAQATRVGRCVAVYNVSEGSYQVLRRTKEGWSIELSADAAALDQAGMSIHLHFMTVGKEDAIQCWVRDMFTERMHRVRRMRDVNAGDTVPVRDDSAPD